MEITIHGAFHFLKWDPIYLLASLKMMKRYILFVTLEDANSFLKFVLLADLEVRKVVQILILKLAVIM